jgi:lysophospholipase
VGKAFDPRAIPDGAVESRWRAGDGLELRQLSWPSSEAAPKGSILFLPGRGDFYEKYLETLDHWHREGWNVATADWRGQGGSGRLGNDPYTGHIDDFATWIDDLAGLWRDWKAATPGPHVLAGHSMGGHLELRATAEGRADPDGLIVCAPMLGFAARVMPDAVTHLLARIMCKLGDRRRPAWKWDDQPGVLAPDRIELLTHDPDRFADEVWWREHRPEVAMGPGSWGWVERALASMRRLAVPGRLEAVAIPVLILATQADRLVGFKPIVRAARRLRDCEFVHFGPEARHEILREADPVRDRALAACDAFLDRIAGAAR